MLICLFASRDRSLTNLGNLLNTFPILIILVFITTSCNSLVIRSICFVASKRSRENFVPSFSSANSEFTCASLFLPSTNSETIFNSSSSLSTSTRIEFSTFFVISGFNLFSSDLLGSVLTNSCSCSFSASSASSSDVISSSDSTCLILSESFFFVLTVSDFLPALFDFLTFFFASVTFPPFSRVEIKLVNSLIVFFTSTSSF